MNLFSSSFAFILFLVVASSLNSVKCEENYQDELYREEDDSSQEFDPEKPILSLNALISQEELMSNDNITSGIFIGQFIQYILTGSYSGQVEIDNSTDTISLDDLIGIGLLFLSGSLKDEIPFDPEFYKELFADLERIQAILRENGSSQVFVKDLKPYLTPANIQKAVLFYFMLNKDTYYARYKKYMDKEFLGGTRGYCKLHTTLWFDDIVKGAPWAIQMFDAMAKLGPGLFKANINWLGSYTVCNEVNYQGVVPALKGKYCRAYVGFPIDQFAGDLPIDDTIGLTYGMCVPSTCEEDEVKSIASNSLKLMSVFKNAWAKKVECDLDEYPPNNTAKGVMIFLGVIIGWVLICTIYDVVINLIDNFSAPKSEPPTILEDKQAISGLNVLSLNKTVVRKRSKLAQFMINTSMYTNTIKFFRTDNGGKISCLNGIRFWSMIWIIFGHAYNYISDRSKFFLLDNVVALQELNNKWYAQLIINGMFAVDTFFLMSAFLLTISLMNKLEKSRWLTGGEWAYYYIHRYWRLVPPFMIIILIFNFVLPYMGSGPLFNPQDFPPYNNECKEFWWSYLLMVNNFVPYWRGARCMGYLWYIPNDYQFYAISPIFIITLYKFPKAGKFLIGVTLAASMTVLAFLTANVYISRKKDIVFVLLDMWEDVYIKPYCRGAPWLIGMYLGYVFFKYKKVKLSYPMVFLGWTMSTLFALIGIFGGYTNHAEGARRMETFEYALFFAISKLIWPIAIAWIIFACHHGYGGVVNSFLSIKTFVPLTRLSYCAYLIHPVIMVFYNYQQETLFHSTGYTLVYIAIGHIMVSLVLSFFFTLFFEMPFIAIEKLVYSPRH